MMSFWKFSLSFCLAFLLIGCQETPLVNGKSWEINFDDHKVGDYSYLQQNADWVTPKWQMGRNLVTVVDGDDAFSGKSLRLKFLKGVSSCQDKDECIQWPVDLGVKLEKLYYGFRFKLSENFEFIKGGKFPGISGGKVNAGGRVPTGKDGWSVRMMWDGKGRLVQYVYHPDQPGKYGDVLFWKPALQIERGKWHTVQTFVEINTPGKRDGRIISWLNGEVVLDEGEFRFRDVDDLKIEQFNFVSFFGGNGTDWAPNKDEYIYIDDIRLSLTPPFFSTDQESEEEKETTEGGEEQETIQEEESPQTAPEETAEKIEVKPAT